MNYILDASVLIYLIKANLTKEFIDLCENDMVIDKEVYNEVVEQGKENNYPDAIIAENFLINNKFPIIPTDIRKFIHLFRDAGETSCFILAQDNGTCITTDKRAFNKFLTQSVSVVRLDTFFYKKCLNKKYSNEIIIRLLDKLLSVYATNSERYATFIKLLSQKGVGV